MGWRTSSSSTEKLLDVIRRGKGSAKGEPAPPASAPKTPEPGKSGALASLFSRGKKSAPAPEAAPAKDAKGAAPAKAEGEAAAAAPKRGRRPLDPRSWTKSAAETAPAKAPSQASGFLSAFFSGKSAKELAVGVDLGHAELRLILVSRRGGDYTVKAWKTIPFSPDLKETDPEFVVLLRTALDEVLGRGQDADVYASVRSPYSELRQLVIPRVPKSQLVNAVYWSAKKEMPIDEKTQAFDFEVRGEVVEKGATKISVLAYTVPIDDVNKTRELFQKAGYPACGLTVRPFALQNLFRKGALTVNPDDNTANLHIGRALSRIDIFHGGSLVLTRGIKAGMVGMEQALLEVLRENASQAQDEPVVVDLAAGESSPVLTLTNLTRGPGQSAPPAAAATPPVGMTLEKLTLDDAPASPPPAAPAGLTLEKLTLDIPPPAAPAPPPPPSGLTLEKLTLDDVEPYASPIAPAQPAQDASGTGALTLEKLSAAPEPGAPGPDLRVEAEADPAPEPAEPPGPALVGATREPVIEDATRLLMSLTQAGSEPGPDEPGYGLTQGKIIEIIMPATERLVRQVEMTFKHFRLALGNDPVRKLQISGPLCGSERFVAMLGEQVVLECETFDPLGGQGLNKRSVKVPPIDSWERLSLHTAFGLAVSDDATTPNLLFTYRQKMAAAKITFINKIMAAAFLVLLILLTGVFAYQMVLYGQFRENLAGLTTQYQAFKPPLDIGLLTSAQAKAKNAIELKRQAADRREGMAAVAEICDLAPENVKIISLTLDMGKPVKPVQQNQPPGAPPPPPGQQPAKPVRAMVIEGVVTGGQQFFEASLASFLVKLRSSPLFTDLTVDKRSVESRRGEEDLLKFVVSVTLAQG